jgi:hypothetical protein
LRGLEFCPVYFILHSGQVSWYMPLLSYLLRSVPCFVVRGLSVVLAVVNVTLTSVFLNSLVIHPVSFLMYVNFAHFLSLVSRFFLFANFVHGGGFLFFVNQD